MDQGFSLTEVLVSLVLMTTTSLALLHQQWQLSQFVNEMHTRDNALWRIDNATERLQAGITPIEPLAPFTLHISPLSSLRSQQGFRRVNLQITWAPLATLGPTCCVLKRQLAILLPHV